MKDLRIKILSLYEAMGLSSSMASGWALPEPDIYDLLKIVLEKSPKKILEIGSYVGITTNMMASLLPDDIRIDAIDPNQVLKIEDEAMLQKESLLDLHPFELGCAVARELGVDHKIFWHAGGSTTCGTFATENSNRGLEIDVIGEEVCKAYGPYDFIFIDALHYEFAVRLDLELAAKWLLPGGIIAMHDVLGRWGSHVRRALHSFLAEHPEFTVVHFPYSAVIHGMGFLMRKGEAVVNLQINPADLEKGLWQAPMVTASCAWVRNHLGAKRILFVGPDLHRHAAILASQGLWVAHAAREGALGCEHLAWNERGPIPAMPTVDLCIFYHAALPGLEESETLIETLCECAPRVLLSATPPGEFGVANLNAKVFQIWAKFFALHKYVVSDKLMQHLEPWLYAIYNNPCSLNNSYGLYTCIFERCEHNMSDHNIAMSCRSAELSVDCLALNSNLMDAYRQIHLANLELGSWISWKKQVDERELQWVEWKKQVDERELQWFEWKKQVDERELRWFEWKKTIDDFKYNSIIHGSGSIFSWRIFSPIRRAFKIIRKFIGAND